MKKVTKARRRSRDLMGNPHSEADMESPNTPTEAPKMVRDEGFGLFDMGKTPQDLMKMGVPRTTAYSWYKDWRGESVKTEEMSEGEKTALLFSLFKQGKELADVVIETKLPYDEVVNALDKYEDATETVILKHDAFQRWVNRFRALDLTANHLADRLSDFDEQLRGYTKCLDGLQGKIDELSKACAAIDNPIKQGLACIVEILAYAECPKCKQRGMKLLTVCPRCSTRRPLEKPGLT